MSTEKNAKMDISKNQWRSTGGMQKMLNIFVFNMIATDFCTVKLGDKERFDKDKICVKELFRDYQPFYTINLPLDKELLPIKKMSKLGVSEHEILKISKKGDFRKSFDQFLVSYIKKSPRKS